VVGVSMSEAGAQSTKPSIEALGNPNTEAQP
jgi:hypothetical protein